MRSNLVACQLLPKSSTTIFFFIWSSLFDDASFSSWEQTARAAPRTNQKPLCAAHFIRILCESLLLHVIQCNNNNSAATITLMPLNACSQRNEYAMIASRMCVFSVWTRKIRKMFARRRQAIETYIFEYILCFCHIWANCLRVTYESGRATSTRKAP